jgi:hypothetical protein
VAQPVPARVGKPLRGLAFMGCCRLAHRHNTPRAVNPHNPSRRALVQRVLAVTLLSMPLTSQAIEEPDYQVTQKLGSVELRQYAAYVVAEVVVNASPQAAGNQAFPILAGYIFGKNKGEKKMAMTAPVTQTAAVTAEPMRMEMTAPVTQDAVAGGMRVQFVLPKGVTLQNAPEPLDARVQLREVAPRAWAVIRYSGTWSQANYDDNLALLKSALSAAAVATQGEPVLARYNGPLTPWFLRRNEIWLALVP